MQKEPAFHFKSPGGVAAHRALVISALAFSAAGLLLRPSLSSLGFTLFAISLPVMVSWSGVSATDRRLRLGQVLLCSGGALFAFAMFRPLFS